MTRNVRTAQFRDLFGRLPAHIQDAARAAFRLFVEDPRHPSLRYHALQGERLRVPSFSASITMKYRAIHTVDGDTNVWYWIGTHNDYEDFIGRK